MTYKTRPGITRVKVCGVHLLVPTRSASAECPHVMRISALGCLLYRLLEDEKSMQDVYMVYSAFTQKPVEEVEKDVGGFLHMLCENGFLIEVPDEEETNDGP